MRKSIYALNKLKVEQFNRNADESKYYTQGLNHLSDLTMEEIMDTRMGLRVPDNVRIYENKPEAEQFLRSILQDNSTDVPDEVDWRQVPGRVSSIKDQGHCGSCWAFSVVGALEAQEVVRVNSSLKAPIDLSPQQLIDCSGYGCGGGWMPSGFGIVAGLGGIDDVQSYPYEAQGGDCRFKKDKVVINDSGSVTLPQGDEQKLKEVVAKFGPVSVAVNAFQFLLYHGGIMDGGFCKDNKIYDLNHAVLVVGYGGGNKKEGDYWIIKNSWGSHWGEQGYARLRRNKGNQCGVATLATIPTFAA